MSVFDVDQLVTNGFGSEFGQHRTGGFGDEDQSDSAAGDGVHVPVDCAFFVSEVGHYRADAVGSDLARQFAEDAGGHSGGGDRGYGVDLDAVGLTFERQHPGGPAIPAFAAP